MAFALGQKALAAGYRLASYESIGSTSREASVRAKLGDPGRLWIVAKAQTEGRGRRGRSWQTPEGNLAASLLMLQQDLGSTSATLGFAAGLALESAIRNVAFKVPGEDVRVDVRLKWPNDVLIDGAKVAGILLETAPVVGGSNSVVIGIGVNVRHAPSEIPYPATSLAERRIDVTTEALFEALAETWVEYAALWNAGQGFAAIRTRWLERAAGRGAPMSVKIGDAIVEGAFETIDEEGRLIVRTDNGSAHTISAGEVHFGAAATVAR